MSTIVVVKKNGKAAIGADTLSTLGSTKCGSGYLTGDRKIYQCGNSHIGIVGSVTHGLVFANIIKKHRKLLSFDSTSNIFETYLRLHPILKDEYFLKTAEEEHDEYESSQIDALIANPHGIFGMYSWREVDQYSRFWAIGSGWQYALGAMFAVYDQLEDAAEIARIGVTAGCEFDDGSGSPVQIKQIKLKKLRK